MAYITQTDLARQLSDAELVQMTDDAGTGEIDSAVVDQAIADAEAEVNGYLGGELAEATPLIAKLCVDIAAWNLYSRRKVLNLGDSAVGLRYASAVKVLSKFASGEISLGTGTPPADGGASARGSKSAAERTVTLDKMANY